MPPAQCNEMSALTLLALAGIGPRGSWKKLSAEAFTIHRILAAIGKLHGRVYAENTRETVRRQVIHQFVQAAIVERNPDDPSLATNSPRTHYRLTPEVAEVLRQYGSKTWTGAVRLFSSNQAALLERYSRIRERHLVPLRLPTGEMFALSPGMHNTLQARIVEEFAPRFAPGSTLLYLGDSSSKELILESAKLDAIGFSLPRGGKLPDVVLVDGSESVIFLIEAATTHGPVTPKRRVELEEMLARCELARAYVSAFPSFAEFKKFARDIAWETDVWVAEIPEHLIHYNGGELQFDA